VGGFDKKHQALGVFELEKYFNISLTAHQRKQHITNISKKTPLI
jgi:hypothetical protein